MAGGQSWLERRSQRLQCLGIRGAGAPFPTRGRRSGSVIPDAPIRGSHRGEIRLRGNAGSPQNLACSMLRPDDARRFIGQNADVRQSGVEGLFDLDTFLPMHSPWRCRRINPPLASGFR
jgi:hypothetical protein